MRKHLPILCAAALVAACSTTEPARRDPALEAQYAEKRRKALEQNEQLAALPRVLNDLDKALDKYAEATMSSGNERAEKLMATLDRLITELGKKNFDELVVAANDVSIPRNRAIAVAALGFCGRAVEGSAGEPATPVNSKALDPLLNAVQSDNEEVIANAVFGLGILGDPRTPPAVIARVMLDANRPEAMRTGAAWSLYRLQLEMYQPSDTAPYWLEVLNRPIEDTPPGVLVSAMRGVGLLRDPEHLDAIAKYTSHPTAMVRQMAALSLGRLLDMGAVPSLLALIAAAETNDNVRLAARKGLQALAGGVDRGYDVDAWRQVFDR